MSRDFCSRRARARPLRAQRPCARSSCPNHRLRSARASRPGAGCSLIAGVHAIRPAQETLKAVVQVDARLIAELKPRLLDIGTTTIGLVGGIAVGILDDVVLNTASEYLADPSGEVDHADLR